MLTGPALLVCNAALDFKKAADVYKTVDAAEGRQQTALVKFAVQEPKKSPLSLKHLQGLG